MQKTGHAFADPVLETAIFPGIISPAIFDELVAGKITRIELCCVPHRFNYNDPVCVEKISESIKRCGIAVSSVHLPFGPDYDLSSREAQKRVAAIDELEIAVNISRQLGASVMVLHPGIPLEDGENRRERLEYTAESLRLLLDRLPKSGFCLALENLPPGYIGTTAEELAWLIHAVDDVRVGFCLDTGHAHLTGEMIPLLHLCGKYLRNIHIHDNSGDGDRHLVPGRGTIDWPALMAELGHLAYNGPLTWEIVNENDPAVRCEIMRKIKSANEQFWRHDGAVLS